MYKLHLYIYKIMDNNKCIDLKRDVNKIKIKVTFPTVLPLFSDANIFFLFLFYCWFIRIAS